MKPSSVCHRARGAGRAQLAMVDQEYLLSPEAKGALKMVGWGVRGGRGVWSSHVAIMHVDDVHGLDHVLVL